MADLLLTVLVRLSSVGAAVAGLVAMSRTGRRKGYRGPFLLTWLIVLACAVTIGAATAAGSLHLRGNAALLVFPLITALVLSSCLLVVRVLPRRPERVPGVRRARFPFAVAAIVLPIGVIVATAVLHLTGQEVARLGGVAGLGAVLLSMANRKSAPQAAEAAGLDLGGSSVLLLRAFRDERVPFSTSDGRRARGRARRLLAQLSEAPTAEGYLAKAVAARIGPLVGLGNPIDYLPPDTGLLRHYAADATWEAEVRRLVPRARAVLLLASSSTRALAWELDHLRETAAQPKTFLLLSRFPPPGERGAPRYFWWHWRLRGVPPWRWSQLVTDMGELGWHLPSSYPGRATVIAFDRRGRGRVLVSGARTATVFADAVADALDSGARVPLGKVERLRLLGPDDRPEAGP